MFDQYGYKKIGIEDIEVFEKYYRNMEGPWASSICIDSMLAWNDSIITYYKIIDEYISAIAYDVANRRYVSIPLIGSYKNGHFTDAIIEVISIFEKENMEFIMTDVSEWMLEYYTKIQDIHFQFKYDESLSDYLYRMDDFKKSLAKQETRYNINYFMRKYSPQISEMKDEDVDDCVNFVEEVWCSENGCDFCEYGCLKLTARNIIGNISKYNARGIVVRSEGQVIAYCIVSVRGETMMFHFKKTARHYRGINEVLHKECIERFSNENTKYINYTEDMGHEGLRKYKQRLAEYKLQHKYELYIESKQEGSKCI